MSDFIARVVAELDTQEAQAQLQSFLNEKNKLKIDVELNQDSAQKLSSSLEKGIKKTKIDNLSAGNIKKYAKGTDHVGHNSVC